VLIMKRLLLLCVVAFLAAYSAPTKLFAQGATETGTISGTVTDPTGAVVPNAKVTVVNPATSAQRVSSTDARGAYAVVGLLPAVYSVTVEASGFAKAEKRAQVTVGTPVTVDFQLTLGAAVSTTVEVTGAAGVAVNTENQTLSSVLDTARIEELPTLTRNIYSLVLTSGMVSEDDPSGGIINGRIVGRGAGPAINGLRSASTNILLDGGANNDEFTASVGQPVPLDSVQEYSIITNQFSAQYGRAAAGVVNVATKSGTNSFHGTVYDFNRVSALASNTFDNNAHGRNPVTGQPVSPKPVFTRNQFGYSVGGPIKKSKVFFFSNTEWTRIRSAGNINLLVPDPALLAAANANTQSFFSTFGRLRPGLKTLAVLSRSSLTPSGVPLSSGDPCRRALASGPCQSYPFASPLFDEVSYNVPNDAGGGVPQNAYDMVQRVDWNISANTQFYARYSFNNQIDAAGTIGTSPYVGYDTGQRIRDQNALLALTHTFSPRFSTATKFVFNRLKTIQPLGAQPVSPVLFLTSGGGSLAGIPTAFPGYLELTPGSGIPFGGPQNFFQTYEDATYTKGAHTLQFGGSYVFLQDDRTFGAYEEGSEILGNSVGPGLDGFLSGQLFQFQAAVDPRGAFPCKYAPAPRFLPSPPNPPNTPNPQAGQCVNPTTVNSTGIGSVDFTGNITTPARPPNFSRSNRYNELAAYFQDSWKMRPRLTINLGLRWDYYGIQHNKDPRLDSNYYDAIGGSTFNQIRNGDVSIAGQSAVGGLWAKDRKDFGPRLGFAWDVFGNGKTALRGGYGITYERNFGNVTFNVIQNPPNYAVLSLLNGTDVPAGTLPVTTANFGPLSGSGITKALPRVSLRNVNPNIKSAYAHLWSTSIEHQFGQGIVVGIDYSGSKGKRLYTIENPNRPGSGNVFLGDPCTPVSRTDPATLQVFTIPAYPCFNSVTFTDALGNPFTVSKNQLSRLRSTQYTNINRRGTNGASIYNALNFRVDLQNPRIFGRESGLTLRANYTYAHAIDNLSSTFSEGFNVANLGLLDPFNPTLDRGSAEFDNRHRIALSAIWAVPYGRHVTSNVLKRVFDGWELAPIFTARTGAPFTIFDCSNAIQVCPRAFNLAGTSGIPRTGPSNQAVAGQANLFTYTSFANADSSYFNPIAGVSDFGPFPANMTGRSTFRGPGAWNLDVGLYKTTAVTERVKIQFRAEMFNALNHSNLYIQNFQNDVSSFGEMDAKRGVPPAAVINTDFGFQERRNVQLAVKVIF
jgi:outer membrane receptor protein involved in Fe transport